VAAVTESENFKKREDKLRSLRVSGTETEEGQKKFNERRDENFVKERNEGLREEIDRINNNPDNRKYLNEFFRAKSTYKRMGHNLIDLLKEGLTDLNLKANTGRSKFEEGKAREVDFNYTDIDSK